MARTSGKRERARHAENDWQRDRLPAAIPELVLDGQRLRNELCWFAFDLTRG